MKSFFTKTTNVILSIIIVAVALLVAIFSITKNNKSTNSSLTANNLFAVNYAELTDPHPYYLDEDGNYQLDEEENIIDPCENINFEAYFPQKQGTGVVRHSLGTCKSLDENDIFLLRLEVNQDGYLKDGKIYFNGKNIAFTKSNQGVGFQSGEVFKEKVTRTLALQNQIEAGNAGVCEISISPNVLTSEDYHREDNIITLTGTYVDGENVEHSIRKDIPLTVDWYGKAKAYLQNRNNSVAYSRYLNQRGKIIIEFTVSETEEQLVPEAVCAVLDFNDESAMLAGEYPTSVVCQDGVYDAETRKLTIRRETTNRSNTFSVEVNYSDDVYDRVSNTNQEFNGYSLRIPVSAYYECRTIQALV